MADPLYWATWAVVVICLTIGILVAMQGRRLSGLWYVGNLLSALLYLCTSIVTLLGPAPFADDLTLAGLQFGTALAILLVSSYRLHMVGVAILVAGSGGLAVFRIAFALMNPLAEFSSGVLIMDIVSLGFLMALWACLDADLRRVAIAMHRDTAGARNAAGIEC